MTPDNLYPELTRLTQDLGYAWLENPRIVIFQMDSGTREVIDASTRFSVELRENWDERQLLLMLIDISSSNYVPSSYAQRELRKIIQTRPELKYYCAMVLARNFMSHLIETMMRLAQHATGFNPNRVFYNREEAVTWLRQMADQFDQSSA